METKATNKITKQDHHNTHAQHQILSKLSPRERECKKYRGGMFKFKDRKT